MTISVTMSTKSFRQLLNKITVIGVTIFASTTLANRPLSSPVEAQRESDLAIQRIMENLNEPGLRRGAIIASPSRRDPDYFYHWTRDAGLTVATLIDQRARFPVLNAFLRDWTDFERFAQEESQRSTGLGEPKFHVNGHVFRGDWGRPQNDGPAIRSWAYLNAFGRIDPLVQTDLEYLRRHWGENNIDLWEEVHGHHFFTRYSQMAAFRTAAIIGQRRGERTQSQSDASLANQIESTLSHFVDTRRALVMPTVGRTGGPDKPAGLDISVVLAVIYFGPTAHWSVTHPYVMSTVLKLEDTFRELYPVNKRFPDMAPAIGRYPEDVYDGNGFSQGHGWFLASFGMAEYYCTLVDDYARRGEVRVDKVNLPFLRAHLPVLGAAPRSRLTASQPEFRELLGRLRDKGRSYIQRSFFHAGSDRRFAEQLDRNTGFRRGAKDLTWSYASSVRALRRCYSTASPAEPFIGR